MHQVEMIQLDDGSQLLYPLGRDVTGAHNSQLESALNDWVEKAAKARLIETRLRNTLNQFEDGELLS